MPDRRLQVFHAVATQLSFTRAAEVLLMTQPAVTFQIKQLEEQLHTRLFDRAHNRIELTPAGELVLEYAERILAQSSELEGRLAELTDEVGGSLLVGASLTVAECVLPRILGEFKSCYPKARIRLVVGNSAHIESRVAENTLDVGLIESASNSSQLMYEACGQDELVAVCAPTNDLAKLGAERGLTAQDLVGQPHVAREAGSGTRELFEIYLAEQGVHSDQLDVVLELGNISAIKGVLESGLGYTMLSRAAVTKECELGSLVALPMEPKLVRKLWLITPGARQRSRLLQTFLQFCSVRVAP